MPPRTQQYTLVGFSAELDWKPLQFVRPLPPNRVCSACGLVRPKTALLPCAHTLCVFCHEQCALEGSHICPLDAYEFQDEDVDWRDFPAQELLRREVKCWNEGTGCRYVAAASGITHHFLRECGHHCVSCPKCSAAILCCGVVAHMKSTICCPAQSPALDCDGQAGAKNEAVLFSPSSSTFQEQVDEVKDFLGRIVGDIKAHGDRLNEISHGINDFRETLRQGLAAATRKIDDSVVLSPCEAGRFKEEIKESLTTSIAMINSVSGNLRRLEKTQNDVLASVTRQALDVSKISLAIEAVKAATNDNSQALDHIKHVLRRSEQGISLCVFFVKNVTAHQEIAMKTGWTVFDSEQVYLRGYCLTPGVKFRKEDELVKLLVRLRLHKGEMDDVVQWPFEQRIKLSIIHPGKGPELSFDVKTSRSLEYYQKPTATSNLPVHLAAESLAISDLISGGYVEGDQLRVKWELLS